MKSNGEKQKNGEEINIQDIASIVQGTKLTRSVACQVCMCGKHAGEVMAYV